VAIPSPATCTIREPQTGAATGVTVTTTGTFTVNGGAPQPFVLGTTRVPVGPGDAVAVSIDNALAPASVATAPPSSASTGGGTTALSDTGEQVPSPALALFVIGAGIVLVAVARRRTSR
jgi:hypothetical protein